MISSQRYSVIRAPTWSIVYRRLSVKSYDRVKINRKKKYNLLHKPEVCAIAGKDS